MKRGSIVAPVILILLGALFLSNNLRPDVPLLEFLGRYWPFLLIGWGFIRLVEIVVWAVRGQTLPNSGVSGGEWVLAIFLSLVGTGLYEFHTHVGWPPGRIRMGGIEMFGEAFEFPIADKKVPAAKRSRVILENLRGHVRVTGKEIPDVEVRGRKTVRALHQKAAEQEDRITPLEVIEQPDAIVIRTNQNRAGQERYVTAELEIDVPLGMSIEARGRDGDFDISGVGKVVVESARAGIRAENIGGLRVNLGSSDVVRARNVKGEVDLQGRGNDVELENVEGQVTIDGSWGGDLQFRNLAKPLRYQGSQAELHMEKVNGEARLGRGFLTGEAVVGPIRLHGRNNGCCDVRLSEFSSTLDLDVRRGDIELQPSNPIQKMDVRLESGNVTLALPERAQFQLKAQVEKGEVENEFGPSLKATNEERGGLISGGVGDGARISIISQRGAIKIRKADGVPSMSPLTPQPPPRPPRVPRPPDSDL